MVEIDSRRTTTQTARMTSVGIKQLYDPIAALAAWFLAFVPLALYAADDHH